MNPLSWSVGVVLVSTSMLAPVAMSERRQEAEGRQAPTVPASYAYLEWVHLNEILPPDAPGPDVYVRLIAIEGNVVLPVDDGQ